jgi:hypothetical protein
VSALKGHDVTLFEARERLGGALALWSRLPGREVFQTAIDWWEREIDLLGVTIRRSTEATSAMLLNERPHAVIIATGARYSVGGRSSFLDRDIPGHEQSFVHRPEDILLGGLRLSGKVVLLDAEGLHTSVGTAELLGKMGAQVEYLTPNFAPMSTRLVSNQDSRFIMKRLRAAGVKLSPMSYIKQIGFHAVTVYDVYTEEQRTIDDVDAVLLSTARVPVDSLSKELEGKVEQLFTIGDALAARLFATATYEAQKFARHIGEPDAPRTFAEAFFRKNPPEFAPQPADYR